MGEGQPAWWGNVDQQTESALFVAEPPRPGRRLGAAVALMLLAWAGMSALGASARLGFVLSAGLASVLVNPAMPALARGGRRLVAGRQATHPLPTLAGVGGMLVALAGGCILAWGVAGSPWGSGVGNWSVLVFWGAIGVALLGASVHALPRRDVAIRPDASLVPELAARLAVGLATTAVVALGIGIVAGGLARSLCFAAGCIVASAYIVRLARGPVSHNFIVLVRCVAVGLVAWMWVVSGVVAPAKDSPAATPHVDEAATDDATVRSRFRGLAGNWEGEASGRGRLDGACVYLDLRRAHSGRHVGELKVGGCRSQVREVSRGAGSRILRLHTTTMLCAMAARATVQLIHEHVRAVVHTGDGIVRVTLRRTPEDNG